MWGYLSQTTVRFWAIIGFLSTVVGFGGVPDDIATWSRWIETAVNDPFVLWLAEHAVAVAEFINQGWFRIALVIAGVLMMIWPLRWFWRLRHRWLFKWRRLVAEQVWIARDDAIKLVKESPWGRIKEPNVVRTVSLLDSMAMSFTKERTVYGMSETQKKLLKYEVFLVSAPKRSE
jgi:hypothetical protein